MYSLMNASFTAPLPSKTSGLVQLVFVVAGSIRSISLVRYLRSLVQLFFFDLFFSCARSFVSRCHSSKSLLSNFCMRSR